MKDEDNPPLEAHAAFAMEMLWILLGLVRILTDPQEDEPRLVPFIRALWELAVEKGAKWMPDRLPIHTSEWRKLKMAMTTIGGRKGYIIYRDWMMNHRYKRRPLLELVEKGGSPDDDRRG